MIILSNARLNNFQEVMEKNPEEKVCTWSVQFASRNFSDDIFNGTFIQCKNYLKKHFADMKKEGYAENEITEEKAQSQIALVELDTDGCVTYTHNVKMWCEEE